MALALILVAAACVTDGTWTVLPTITGTDVPPLDLQEITDVSCASTQFCMVVGQSLEPPFTPPGPRTTATWDGSSWTVIDGPNPPDTIGYNPAHISCATATRCASAFSYYEPGVGDVDRFGVWDGSTWTLDAATTHEIQSWFNVSCAPDGTCLFVEALRGTTVFDGSGFHWFPSATTPPLLEQRGLSCLSRVACLGVGPAGVWQWDGGRWTTIAPQPPERTTEPNRSTTWDAFDCTAPTNCFAVGTEEEWDAGHVNHLGSYPAAARFDGTGWTATPVPFERGSLGYLSCADAAACVALIGGGRSAIGWIGNQWVSLPDPPAMSEYFAFDCGGERCLGVGKGDNRLATVVSYDWSAAS